MKSRMYPMTIREVHIALFDVLCEVDRVLKENNIKYYLMYGTLLGCIRDGGPIKWDDDIDICVDTSEWLKMNKALETGIDRNKFFILNRDTKQDYPKWKYITRVGVNGTYRRMDFEDASNESGIFIDIFQLTSIPDSKRIQKIWEYQLGVVDGIINMHSMKKGSYPKPYILSRLLYCITTKKRDIVYWNDLRYMLQNKYNGIGTTSVTVPFGPFGVYPLRKARYNREWFERTDDKRFCIKNEKGEVIREAVFPVPSGYKKILETTYGNWKKKPLGRAMPKMSFWEEAYINGRK